MKTIYLECKMGAAGDMLMAALLELHEAPDDFLRRLNSIGIPGVTVSAEPSVKCGITGTHIRVRISGREEASQDIHGHSHSHGHDHSHGESGHSSFHGIEHLIGHLSVSESVKKNALDVYRLIAEAESRAHGVPVTKVHFHEVGEMDALADIVGCCMLLEELSPGRIISSPVNVGGGHVRCSHGILPVPAPATAFILKGAPIYSDDTKGELCTPTGAALLKHFADEFCALPEMVISGIGYGMGTKDFEKANCVRAFIGQLASPFEQVSELVCNLDDMTAEAVAFAQQLLLDEGALDCYTVPVGMKKGRAGLSFTCMCRTGQKDKMLSLIFKHTTTLGVREYVSRRYALQKEHSEIQTKYGAVRVKTSHGFGVKKAKPEYDDIAKIASRNGLALSEVMEEIM